MPGVSTTVCYLCIAMARVQRRGVSQMRPRMGVQSHFRAGPHAHHCLLLRRVFLCATRSSVVRKLVDERAVYSMVTMVVMADDGVLQTYLKQPSDTDATLCQLRASVLLVVAASLNDLRLGRIYRCKTAVALAPKLIEFMSNGCERCAPVTQPVVAESSCCRSLPPPTLSPMHACRRKHQTLNPVQYR